MKNLNEPHKHGAAHHDDACISPAGPPRLDPQEKRDTRQKQKERRAGQYRKNKINSFRHIFLPYLEAVTLCTLFAVFTSPASGLVFFASLIITAIAFTLTRALGNILGRRAALPPVLYGELMGYVRAAKFSAVAAAVFFLLPGVPGLFLPFAPLAPTESFQLWAMYPASHVVSWLLVMLSAMFSSFLFLAPSYTPSEIKKEGASDA